eukprot:2420193-Amphidinium_carterae.1
MKSGLTKTLRKKQRARATPIDTTSKRSLPAEKDAVQRALRWRASVDNDEEDIVNVITAVARKWLIDTGSAYDVIRPCVNEGRR